MVKNNQLDAQITEGNYLIKELEGNRSLTEIEDLFSKWRKETNVVITQTCEDGTKGRLFLSYTEWIINKFSELESRRELILVIEKGLNYMNQLKLEFNHVEKDQLDTEAAVMVIRRILCNFYKHLEVMYQEDVHGKGKITKEQLRAIRIGNEYDVQRILYSLIRPIFPQTRVEVVDDTGYKPIRYDIKIEEYNLVIEVKCTRSSMTERSLAEELGSDAFHYQADYLFFFIYDKEKIIKNVDAFMSSYRREKEQFGTYIEAIVNQPVDI